MDVRAGLKEVGFTPDLLREDYAFADVYGDDVSSPTSVVSIKLAAFAQDPPSYRNACMGVAAVKSHDPKLISPYRALGAPQVLSIVEGDSSIHRWKIRADNAPYLLDRIERKDIRKAIVDRKHEWNPEAVLRAKSIGAVRKPVQLDFFDVGLLPALEEMVHTKLDRLLRSVLDDCEQRYQQRHGEMPPPEQLFRLIFRLIGAKLLGDREHPGGPWTVADAAVVIEAVEKFYFAGRKPEVALADREVRDLAWESIRSSLHLQNLSAEALAYIWEETLVSPEHREKSGIHATPFQIAEYAVRRLPFESLEQRERLVFEPFCGHAPFLTAAMGRLRTLLPRDMSSEERHAYFVRMLAGMEEGTFGAEIARWSLMLADYPNANSWRIEEGEVFHSPRFDTLLRKASVVLCNPPYGKFAVGEPPSADAAAHKQVEALRLVLNNAPKMLGFLLPRVFVNGQSYHAIHQSLTSLYDDIEIVALPDNVFRHSGMETVLLIASGSKGEVTKCTSILVEKPDYARFIRTGKPTWQVVTRGSGARIWHTPLEKLWETLEDHALLSEVAEPHRGLEYNIPLEQEDVWLSVDERQGFSRGLARVREDFEPYAIRGTEHLNIDPELMRGGAYKLPWGKPKVIVNVARRSRGCWGLTCVVDHVGLVCSQRFDGIWPRNNTPLEFIAAVMNGAIANAFTRSLRTGRDNQIRAIKRIPIPPLDQGFVARVTSLVKQYIESRWETLGPSPASGSLSLLCKEIMWHIDAEVVAAYNLPPDLERVTLDYAGRDVRSGPYPFEVIACPVPNGRQMIVREQILARRPVLDALLKRDLSARLLESFRGRVNSIENGTAYVTLIDREGKESSAECPSDRLWSQGIAEGADFVCAIWHQKDKTVVSYFPLPTRQLLNTERTITQKEIEELLSDADDEDRSGSGEVAADD